MVIEQLNNSIKHSKNILIVSHINPDGDTLGSMCAMFNLIKDNYKKTCDMVAVSDVPTTYQFLPEADKIKHINEYDLSRIYDLVINVDIAAPDRCTDAKTLFDKAKNNVNIDHHETNLNYGNINIVHPKAAATAEVIFDIAQQLKWKISEKSAICLYVGIMTDTGCFRFSNTTPKTMDFAGKLITLGAKPDEMFQKCYESNSKEMVLFQNYCIGKSEFLNNDKIAFTTVYKKDLEKFNNQGEDFTDGLTEKLRAIKTTEIAFVIKETGNSISKLSMRSKTVNVAQICSKFGGGGHKLAAGAVIKSNVETAVKLVLKEIENSTDL